MAMGVRGSKCSWGRWDEGRMYGRYFRIVVHLVCVVEAKYSGDFLKSRKVILMRIPNNGGYRISITCFSKPGKVYSSRTGWHAIKFLTNGVHMNIRQTTQPAAKQTFAFWKMAARLHCWGQHPHNSKNMDKLSCCLYGSFIPISSMFGAERHSIYYRKKPGNQPSHKTLDL